MRFDINQKEQIRLVYLTLPAESPAATCSADADPVAHENAAARTLFVGTLVAIGLGTTCVRSTGNGGLPLRHAGPRSRFISKAWARGGASETSGKAVR